jgi:hypothetical protein
MHPSIPEAQTKFVDNRLAGSRQNTVPAGVEPPPCSAPQQEDVVAGEVVNVLRSLQEHQLWQDRH